MAAVAAVTGTCSHCGTPDLLVIGSSIVTHSWPPPTRQVCPGSGSPPTDAARLDLEGLEHHAHSSGTSTAPIVRMQILAATAEIRRLRARVAELEANAVRMREYRFALEGIATDGKGNPLPSEPK